MRPEQVPRRLPSSPWRSSWGLPVRSPRPPPAAGAIDAARGGVGDEPALLQAREAGRLAGAALDVFGREPPGRDPLLLHPAVVATPHIGAQTAAAQQHAGLDIASEAL